jgi:hypothetical protein
MSSDFRDLLKPEHFPFAKYILELLVVDAGIAPCHDQDHASIVQFKRKRFGNATGLNAMGLCCQCHGGCTDLQLNDGHIELLGFEKFSDG